MVRTVAVARTTDAERAAVDSLLRSLTVADQEAPLSDQFVVELHQPSTSTATIVLFEDGTRPLSALAVLQPANDTWTIETVVSPSAVDDPPAAAPASPASPAIPAVLDELFTAALGAVAVNGGGDVTWWQLQTTQASAPAVAQRHGFAEHRLLHQMRRSLPIDETAAVHARPFVIGRDEDAWLRVNNRAFAEHAEQGGWGRAALAKRIAEPWFDPSGFLLHERDGELAAFCWTKVHATTAPPMGEIYAIAVDPKFHGLGLGRALTVAGLTHLAADGLGTAMLHVDAGNAAAVGLYRKLGFEIHHTDRALLTRVVATGAVRHSVDGASSTEEPS